MVWLIRVHHNLSLRIVFIAFFAGLFILGLVGTALAQTQAPHVLVLKVDGVINPVKERLIQRAIQKAEDDEATLLVIELDTPGGLLDSTRKIVESMLATNVPTVVYVSPRGARAGSAGTFITAAAHFAVMSPASNIGAATPVSGAGEDLPKTLANKATNDAAALIRSIAQERGRNADKLEETVRQAASFTATEAVALNVVDFMAEDLDDLLAQLDGQTVTTNSGTLSLDTRDIQRRRVNKTFLEHFLEFISDPNVIFILITIGGLGLVIELFNPGLYVPGVVGIISLLLAYLAIGNLPVNWAGVAFILLAVGLAVLETQVAGWGVLGVGAIVSFLVGGLILFTQFGGRSPTLPSMSVNLWLLGGVAAVLALTLLYLLRVVYQTRAGDESKDHPSLVGEFGIVTRDLAPRGIVELASDT
ncbi:MAG: nodulation protein NfeD [Chloroflexi bacterium]|nr:nodulation protein NfeD [Chloroflexota bacterium]